MLMKKIITNKNLIIVVLCITIVLLSVGFTLIAIKLESREKNDKIYDVSIVRVEQGTAIKGGASLPSGENSIENNGKTAKFLFNLSNPKDTLTYIITIKNNGNLKAQIDGLAESPDYLKDTNEANSILPVIINHNDINGQTLKPGEEIKLTVTAEFMSSGEPMPRAIPYQVSVLSSCVE